MVTSILRRAALVLCTLLATVSAGVHAQAVCSAPGSSGSGTISGVVNTYFQGNGNLAANATTLTLGTRDTRGANTPVTVGTLLLLIQMQDGSINSSNSSLYGDGTGSGQGTLTVGNAGLHEFVTVTATSGTGAGANVTFSPPLTNSYTQAASTGSSGQKRYQVIIVPQYATATASGVTAPAWGLGTGATGETGGVVAIDVQGALTLGSATVEGQAGRAIFVAGKGFRGAAGRQSGADGANTDWATTATGAHGGKGEGIAGTPRYMAIKGNGWGAQGTNAVANASNLALLDNGEGYPGGSHARGAPGNAGGGGTDGNASGGGNNENSGGGGGGGYAQGGLGGRPWNAPLVDSDGRGGAGYGGVLAFNRLFPGGGGGSGGSNDATVDAGTYENEGISCTGVAAMCSSGAAGGGVVIVRARSVGGGGVIDARGANGYNVANDAGGGGGGGGAVVVYSIDGGSANVDVSGGDGGNAWAGHATATPVADRHGPGGGGGGGFITFAPASFVLNGTVDGGRPGRTTNGVDDTYSSSGYEGGLTTFQTPNTPGILPGAVCSPDLRLAKSDGTSTLNGGGTATYALTVSNIGNSGTTGTITVVDVLPGSLSIANGPVSLGGADAASWSCSASSNVVTCTSSATIGAGGTSSFAFSASVIGSNGTSVANFARVGGGGDPDKPAPTSATTSACTAQDNPAGCATDVDTIQAPLLALTKSDGVADVVAGGTTTYSLVVTNAGALATSGTIRVVDVLPTGLTYAGVSPFSSGGFNCTWTAGTTSFSCDRGTALAAGASTTITIPVSIQATAPSSLTNRAKVAGGGDPGKTTLPTVATASACPAPTPPATLYADTLTGCASDVDTVRHVNLVLDKSDGQPFMPINGQTTYTFSVTNTGDATSSGTITFRDVLPAPMNWPNPLTVGGANAADWSCTRPNATQATCTSTTALAPGASSQFTLVANVGNATSGTQYMNRARIGGGGDPDLVAGTPSAAEVNACTTNNNPLGCAVDLDTAQSAPQVRLAKSHPNPQAHAPGDTIAFSLVVSNSGSTSTAANTVRVIDVLPAGLVYSGAATFTSGGFNCSVAAGPPQVITCNNNNAMNAGASNTITFNATVAAGATNLLFNPAQVGTNNTDPQNASFPTAATAATCVGNGAPRIGCAVDTVPLNANLSIAKTERAGSSGAFTAGPLTVANGSIVQYQLVAANAGPAVVTNASVTDTVPSNFTSVSIVSATAAGGATGCTTAAFALVGNALSGTIASLPSGASCTLVVQGTASTNGSATNTAQIGVPTGINDTNTGDNSSSVVTNILARPTVQVSKVSLGGTGTFAFSGDNGYAGDSITTMTAGTPVAGLTRTLAAAGVATTITETAPPAGFALTQVSCSGLGAGSANIDLANNRVTLSAAAVAPGAAITCTFTNTKQPRITLQKALPNGRVAASDQFALSIAGSTTVNGTTSGTGSAVTSPALVLTGAAGNYTLSETMAAGSASTLAQYASAIACTNAATGSSTVLPSGAGTSFPVTVQPGDDISCTLANTAILADLSISKTDGATSATPGNPISYTIVAGNAGPSAVTGATVTDTIPAAITGATWTAVYAGGASGPANGSGNINASVNLPSGGSATFTVSGTISATATGTLANTATITTPAGTTDPVPGNNSATDTDTLAPSANLAITKTDGATSATPGSTITWTIVASNAGPSAVTGAVVSDTLPASITGAAWTVAYAGGANGPAAGSGNINATVDIPVGGTATFTVTGTIGAGATGTLVNTATIAPPAGTTDPTPGNNSATDSDTLSASADIRVVKTGPASIGYGGSLGYSVVVTNLGPSDANGTTFNDAVPASITGVGATCGSPTGGAACGAVNLAGNTVTSTIPALPSGGSVTFTITGTAPGSGTSVTNSATANPPAGTSDPVPGNNTGTATTNLLQPELSVTKSATPTPFIVGQPASYTITVSNGGAGPTAGTITIADTLPTGITLAGASGTNWSCSGTTTLSCTYTGTLAAGSSTTLTLDVNVAANATNGNNSATASGGGDPTCPAQSRCTGTTTVPVNPSADIAVTKSVDDTTPNVGETVTFTITATNNGPNAATGVAVTDALPSGVAFVSATPSQGTYTSGTGLWTVGALGNGASATLDIVVTVLTPGAITNTATKSAGDQFDPNGGNNAGSASLNAQPSADLQVTKTVSNATPNLGTNVTYTVTVANAGPNAASNVSVDDLLPMGLVFVSATPSQGTYDDDVGLWTIGGIAAGDSVTLQIVATVTMPGDITNTATVDADEHDPNPANNTGGVTLNGQSADIQVLKVVNNLNPVRGDTVTFTITATNNGPSNATGVAIDDVLPAGLGFVSATPSQGTYDSGTGTWTIGNLAASGAGATATLTVVADIDTDAGFTNTASLSAIDQTDPNPANNSASVVVTPIASADLSITKTDGSASATPGAPITYTIVVANAGPSPAIGATVLDTVPAAIVGASWTCAATGGASCTFPSGVGDINAQVDIPAGGSVTFTLTGTVASNASGTLVNTATVAPPAGTTDADPANNSATDTDALNASANLAISKSDGSGTATPGAPITYTIVASNAGPSDANGVLVTDAIPTGITGASWTCVASGTAACTTTSGIGSINTTVDLPAGTTATFTVAGTVAPDATGTLANTATITPPVGTSDPDPDDDTSTDTDNLTPGADLAITKTDGATSATPGAPISYTIVASNAGPSTATNATVVDALPAAILGATWTCTGSSGATCPASGNGSINANVTIPPGASVTFTVTGTVSAAASGTLVNTATVTPPAGTTDPNAGNNSATDSDALTASADLAISKTDGATSATPGAPIIYTIVAGNAGPSDAVGATVADAIPAGITGAAWTCVGAGGATCPAGGSGDINAIVDIPVGASVTFTVTGTIDAAATGALANTATVAPPVGTTDPVPGDNSSTDTDSLAPSANLAIGKTDGSTTATPGAPITYTIVASNAGPSAAIGALVSDALPANISGASWTCVGAGGGVCPPSGSGGISASVDLPVGGTATFTLSGTVAAAATGSLVNTATVTPPPGTADPTPGDNSATDIDTLSPNADLTVTKTDGSANATPGSAITYTIVVGNNGPSDAVGATVLDTIPAAIGGATWSAAYAGGASGPASGSGDIAATIDVPVGGSATFTVSGIVGASATGTLSNTATVLAPAGTTDPVLANNSATDTDTLTPSANLAIGKTDGSASATPGAPITYTIVASNAGPSAVTGATVADVVPANITGATWTCVGAGGGTCPPSGSGAINASVNLPVGGTATFTLSGTVAAGATGTLVNTATVTPPAGTTDPTPADNSATDTDTLAPNADLAITKTDGATSATPGAPISYTIVAGNAGPSDVTGATIADVVPASITGATWTAVYTGGASGPASGSGNIAATVDIPVGGTATFTLAGTVSAGATGTLSNTATIAAPAGTTDPTPANNSATDTDTLNPQSDLMVSKTDGSATATPGSPITYTIVASNAGPSAVIGATVADAIPATITGATWTCVGSGGATCPAGGSGNIAASVDIPVGGNATFTVTGTVSASASGTLSNTATIAAPAGTTDPTPGNNSATDTDALSPNADLAISKTDGSASATPGSPITYTIVASNAGPSDVTAATIADVVPAAITGANWTAAYAGGASGPASGSGNIAATVDIPVGGTATFTLTGTVGAGATGTLANTATIAAPAGTTDPVPGNNSATDTDTLSGSADIEAHKTGPASVTAGAAIAYSVVVTNHGPSDANATTFSDVVPAGITAVSASCGTPTGGAVCGTVGVTGNNVTSMITTLPAGASVTFTIDGTAPADPGTLANTATAQPPAGVTDPAPANNSSSVSTAVDASADLAIVKTGPTTLASGASISYTLVVSNAGPSAADGATWADSVPAAITGVTATCGSATGGATCAAPTIAGNDVTGTVPTLPAGGSVTITISGIAPFGAQSFTNTATVTGPVGVPDPNGANDQSSVTTSIGAAADIMLTKTVDNAEPNVGQTVTFTITAGNAGPNDASGVAVTDSLPFGFGFISATPSVGTYAPATGLWTIGALADGETATLLIVASVDVPGALTNTVAVSASDQPDPDTSNNSAGASVNAGASADIAVAKTVDDATPNVGAMVTYTITASNGGPNDATGVEITDNLPAGTTFVSATPSQGTYAGGVWSVGALANGASATLSISATVDQPGSIVNTATITHEDQFDPVGANNQAGTTINGQQADLGVTKTVDDPAPDVGDSVTFTVTVHNNGPSDATGVALSDALPPGLVFISATPSQGSYDNIAGVWTVGTLDAAGPGSSATLTVVAEVAAAGAMTNTASVSAADQPDPNGANNSASASLNGNPVADLAVTKSGPATVTPGDDVVYTIVVRNDGPSDASNVVVVDPTPAGLVFVSNAGACTTTYPCMLATLASGASATITTTYTVPADYAGANPIVNTASVSATEPDPDSTDNQSSASTSVGAGNANLSIVKTGPATVASGGAIAYTLLVTNNGPSPANGASYSDDVPAGIDAITAACGGEAGGAACGTQPVVSGNTVSGTIGNLPSGGSVLVTIDGVAPAGPVALSNTASVEPPAGVNDPDLIDNRSTVVTAVGAPSADLAIDKTGPASAIEGGNVTYTLTVTNNGPDVATAAQIVDPVPAGLAFVAASLPCAGGFPCALGDLAPGASTIVTVTYTVGAGLGGSVTNTATVTSTTADPDLANNESRVVTPVMPAATSADLVLAKTGPASATPGGQVTYTLHVRNAGPDAALDVVLADPTPANLAFVAASTPCEAGFPCHLGTLASGADTVVTTTYAVAAAATGAIVNSASVTATTPDPDLGNNASSASTTLVAAPAASADLRITKSGPARATAGTVVTYTLVVSNEGPDAVADALLTDPTPAGLAFVAASAPCGSGFPCTLPALASGASTTLTVSYLVQPTFVGRVTNVASVASTTVPDPTPNNNASAATTFVAGAPLAPTQVPVDARWMLLLMSALLLLAGSAAVRRRR